MNRWYCNTNSNRYSVILQIITKQVIWLISPISLIVMHIWYSRRFSAPSRSSPDRPDRDSRSTYYWSPWLKNLLFIIMPNRQIWSLCHIKEIKISPQCKGLKWRNHIYFILYDAFIFGHIVSVKNIYTLYYDFFKIRIQFFMLL